MTNPEHAPIHVIRLRRPWQKQLACQDLPQRIDVPESDLAQDTPVKQAIYTRNFNRPSGLSDTTELRLQIGSLQGELQSLAINDHELVDREPAPDSVAELESCCVDVDIAPLLANHNCITISLTPTNDAPVQLTGPVVLAIYERER